PGGVLAVIVSETDDAGRAALRTDFGRPGGRPAATRIRRASGAARRSAGGAHPYPAPDRRDLADRGAARRARGAHGAECLRAVASMVAGTRLWRGFIDEVRVDARRFVEIAPALYRVAPVLHLA